MIIYVLLRPLHTYSCTSPFFPQRSPYTNTSNSMYTIFATILIIFSTTYFLCCVTLLLGCLMTASFSQCFSCFCFVCIWKSGNLNFLQDHVCLSILILTSRHHKNSTFCLQGNKQTASCLPAQPCFEISRDKATYV